MRTQIIPVLQVKEIIVIQNCSNLEEQENYSQQTKMTSQ